MNDAQFISTLNAVTREHRMRLPVLSPKAAPSSEAIEAWASCLELCMKRGIELSDPRWHRVTVKSNTQYTVFALEGDLEPDPDVDFRVGLQLLMGILENHEENKM